MSEPLFPQQLLDVLAGHPRRVAFEHGPRRVPNAALLALVRKLVAAMQAAGLAPQRSVALHTGLDVEGFAAHLAAHALGCQVLGVRPGWSSAQLAHVLDQGVEAILGDPATLTPEVMAVAARCRRVFSLGRRGHAVDLLAGTRRAEPRPVEVAPTDLSRVTFTSGSTGRPKGCAYTYRTLTLTYQPDRRSAGLARLVTRFDRFLAHTSWAMPVLATFAGRCLLNGGTVVILDGDPRAVMAEAIERHRITAAAMNVPLLHRLLAQLREARRDLSCLRAVVIGGSPASPGLIAAAVEQLGPILWQGYGQAESGMISLLTPEDIEQHGDAALTSVGRPLPDVEINREDGEICVRSPHVMAGYWKDPEQTAEVLRDGWLHTRDLGYLDKAGLLQLSGRSREVIIVNAEVCYAGAIERVLGNHPEVEQAFVVGVPDERTGEAVHAFVLLTRDGSVDRTELATMVRAELTPGHVPRTITVLDEVPVTAQGKPDKQSLAQLV